MKIGIDARTIYRPAMKGIGVYLKNLVDSMNELNSSNEYILFYDGRQDNVSRVNGHKSIFEKNITVKKGDTFFLWEQFRLPKEIKHSSLDIFHSPANTTFFAKKCPTVVTVHDTKQYEIKSTDVKRNFYNQKLQPFILKYADKIICPSEYSKECIRKRLKIDESKIKVIYQGLNEKFRVINNKEVLTAIKNKFQIAGDFILFSGGESPSKNISGLIKAFQILKEKHKIQEKLVITGIRSKTILEKHQREIQVLGIQSEVIILGYLEEDDLIGLYNVAKVFVYPSLYEGFGFPPLEAMACGTPVAASNATSIPEVVGDAAVLFDGKNVNDMAEKIYQTLIDNNLRESLKKKGFERIKKFDWKTTAEETLKVYQEIAR